MKRLVACLGFAAALWLALPADAPAQRAVATASRAPDPAAGTLRPGDALRLRIWLEPDMSGEFEVDEHGRAVLPRLGEVRVVGVPLTQLRRDLTTRYREFLNNPSIEIVPLRRVAIVGAVQNPGVYKVEPTITLGEAVNVAGGPTRESQRNVIELVRDRERTRIDLKQRTELAALPLVSGDQVYLPERSWLSQNATWFVSTLVGVAGTVAYLFVR